MPVSKEIRERLESAFAPRRLEIVDESEGHRGHAGWREGGESHFRVRIESEKFSDMNRLERHRAVHAALGPGLIGRIHALVLEISA